jgi:urease accessory protein
VAVATASETARAVFRGNRAAGRLALTVESASGMTRRMRVYEDGPLRVRFPGRASSHLEAVIVNTAGGIAGGDGLDIGIAVGSGADLVVTTAAAEKVYRSDGDDATMGVRLEVGRGGSLAWLPHETILFDRARLSRSIDVDLADDASLLLAESVVFGRSAMGEAVRAGRFLDRWRVRRGGKLVFADTMRLEGEIACKLMQPAIAAGGVALATVLLLPADDDVISGVRSLGQGLGGEVGISSWNGLAVARLCAKDGAMLRHDLIAVLTVLSERPLPRLWLN